MISATNGDGTAVPESSESSADVVVPVGEYLGMLPFHDDSDDELVQPTFADALMVSGNLIGIGKDQAEFMAFCRYPRLWSEVVVWLRENSLDASVLESLFSSGVLRRGNSFEALDWLQDCVIVPWGRSLGWNKALSLLAPSDEVFEVSPIYYWLWLFSRTGQPIGNVLEFVRTVAGVPDVARATDGDVSGVLMHILAVGLGRLDLPSVSGSRE